MHSSRNVQAVTQNGVIQDIVINRQGERVLHMLGPAGARRELACIPDKGAIQSALGSPRAGEQANSVALSPTTKALPVLIGSGVGFALRALVGQLKSLYGVDFPLAVVDKEADIFSLTKLQEEFANYSQIVWITETSSAAVSQQLTAWQMQYGGLPLKDFTLPFYIRLDREYYSTIKELCDVSMRVNFWGQARYTKFSSSTPRLLMITTDYFLLGELIAAAKRLNYPYHLIQVPKGPLTYETFLQEFLQVILTFKPDFVITINHLGLDREGVLADLLKRLELPLCSWFVDNPHLIIDMYQEVVNDWTYLFTWDQDNLTTLREMGAKHVSYLPLGVDTYRFKPLSSSEKAHYGYQRKWKADISFVGNSMVNKVQSLISRHQFPQVLLEGYKELADAFNGSETRSVQEFIAAHFPTLLEAYEALPSSELKLGYSALVTWEATLLYRLSCVQEILRFHPLIAGDNGWKSLLPSKGWRYHAELNYYEELPLFYPCSTVSFNCTSKQMKGAVNQRILDVPAAGGFLLTDYREQINNLLEPGKEIICYHEQAEISPLVTEYLQDKPKREAVVKAARKRIFAEHTYDQRLMTLCSIMKQVYG